MWQPTKDNPNTIDSEIDYISSTGELKLVNRLSSNAPRQLIHSGEAAVNQRLDCSWILAAPTSSQKWDLK